jgi:hypothetical protein
VKLKVILEYESRHSELVEGAESARRRCRLRQSLLFRETPSGKLRVRPFDVDVARDYGYASGNAVRQVVKRLEDRAAEDKRLKQLLARAADALQRDIRWPSPSPRFKSSSRSALSFS